MNTDLKTLIHIGIEIEGLLKVLDSRDSAEARALLSDKFEEYSNLMNNFLDSDHPDMHVPEVKSLEAEEPQLEDETDKAAAAIERGPAVDIRKSITLNDKFRFVREVFGGNEQDFNDTIAVLSEMDSFREASDYLTADLMLDADNPDVADFLDVVAKCF